MATDSKYVIDQLNPELKQQFSEKTPGEIIPVADGAPKPIDLTKLYSQKNQLDEQVENAQVTNDDEQQRANDLLLIIKRMITKADEERKEGSGWFHTKWKEVNTKYNTEVINPLKALQTKLEAKIKPYTLKKIEEQEAREAEQRKALESAAIEEAREAESQGDLDLADEIINTAQKTSERLTKPRTVRSDFGAVTSSTKVYTYEVSNLSKLLASLLVVIKPADIGDYVNVKDSAIKKFIQDENNHKLLAGVEIKKDVKLTSR